MIKRKTPLQKEKLLLENCLLYTSWVRMLINGAEGYNIQEPVLDMRTGNGMYLSLIHI